MSDPTNDIRERMQETARYIPDHPATEQKAQHPEQTCEKCGGSNIVWFAPNELWNAHAMAKGFGILCPVCFVNLAEADGFRPTAWKVQPESYEP